MFLNRSAHTNLTLWFQVERSPTVNVEILDGLPRWLPHPGRVPTMWRIRPLCADVRGPSAPAAENSDQTRGIPRRGTMRCIPPLCDGPPLSRAGVAENSFLVNRFLSSARGQDALSGSERSECTASALLREGGGCGGSARMRCAPATTGDPGTRHGRLFGDRQEAATRLRSR